MFTSTMLYLFNGHTEKTKKQNGEVARIVFPFSRERKREEEEAQRVHTQVLHSNLN